MTPDEVGQEIRRLLLSLRSPEHGPGPYVQNYATDELRRRALEVAGICWLAPGEMVPGCCCEWSPEDPTGAAKRVEENRQRYLQMTLALTDIRDYKLDAAHVHRDDWSEMFFAVVAIARKVLKH